MNNEVVFCEMIPEFTFGAEIPKDRNQDLYNEIKFLRYGDDPYFVPKGGEDRGVWERPLTTPKWDKIISLTTEYLYKYRDFESFAYFMEAIIATYGMSGMLYAIKTLLEFKSQEFSPHITEPQYSTINHWINNHLHAALYKHPATYTFLSHPIKDHIEQANNVLNEIINIIPGEYSSLSTKIQHIITFLNNHNLDEQTIEGQKARNEERNIKHHSTSIEV